MHRATGSNLHFPPEAVAAAGTGLQLRVETMPASSRDAGTPTQKPLCLMWPPFSPRSSTLPQPGACTVCCNLPPAHILPGEDIKVRMGSQVGSAGLLGPSGRGGLKQSNLAGAAHRDMNNGKLMLNWSHNFHTSANRSKL